LKKLLILVASLIGLPFVSQPVLSEEPVTLHWAGCGISKKAYMVALAKAYEANTGVKIDIQGGGATKGIRDVADQTADIGGSCRRRMRGHEKERGVTMIPVAWDALVVIVHKDNGLEDISMDDLRKVFRGDISNWQELGGADQPVHLLAREGKTSGVGRTARKLIFGDYDQEFAASQLFPSSGPLEKQVETDVYAVGVTGVSSARKRNVKILNLNGKSPTYDNVKTGNYLLYRPMYLAYNENSPNAAQVKEFIKFADSPEGREVIRSNGTVPYLEGLNLMKKKLHESRQAQRDQGVH
jgi:phosphate transport system substrate-binding protein